MKDQIINFVVGNINVIGGVERVTQVLSREFINREADVIIHSIYSSGFDSSSDEAPKIQHYGLTPPDQERNLWDKIKRLLLNGLILRGKLKSKNGYMLFQGFYLAAYLPFLKTVKDKTIVCEHNTYNAPGNASRMARALIYRLFSPHLIVLTEADRKYYMTLGLKKITKIYNPSPYSIASLPNGHNKTLVSLGRFTYQKRFDLMIEICAPLLKAFPDWKLKIQGEGEDLPAMTAVISRLQLEANVHILPPGEPTLLYKEGSIFLMTSLFEGLPMTLIEAMTFGLPAVTYNCSPGLPEIICNDKNGFLVPMDDVQSFVDKLKILIENAHLREKMSQNAMISSRKFDKYLLIEEWDKIIK